MTFYKTGDYRRTVYLANISCIFLRIIRKLLCASFRACVELVRAEIEEKGRESGKGGHFNIFGMRGKVSLRICCRNTGRLLRCQFGRKVKSADSRKFFI